MIDLSIPTILRQEVVKRHFRVSIDSCSLKKGTHIWVNYSESFSTCKTVSDAFSLFLLKQVTSATIQLNKVQALFSWTSTAVFAVRLSFIKMNVNPLLADLVLIYKSDKSHKTWQQHAHFIFHPKIKRKKYNNIFL